MYLSLDVLRARKGDCLMLHFGSKQQPHLILIDGGPSKVYGPQLKPRLQRVHKARKIAGDEPLPIDVVMVSHIDDDHINGILELTEEQRGRTPALRLDVTSLWHNSFDDLLGTEPPELKSTAGFGTAALNEADAGGAAFDAASVLAGTVKQARVARFMKVTSPESQVDSVLASIPQGRQLRDDAEALGWKLNHKFKGRLIVASKAAKPVTLGDDLTLTVVGPMQPELQALQKAHDKWLRDRKSKKAKSSEAALAAFVDESVPNLSSIVVLAEAGDKRVLLTGDARGDKILTGLELTKLLKPKGSMHVDILKVPHHGSDNNMETVFFRRVTADHYVFSGDGEHGNPERKTLEMLLEARGDADYTVHLTYPVAEIDKGRKADWEKEQAKEKARKKKTVRPNWSPAAHSLAAFLKKNPKFSRKVVIVSDKTPHLIDLLDPVKI